MAIIPKAKNARVQSLGSRARVRATKAEEAQLIKQAEKRHGSGVIFSGSEITNRVTPRTTTGNLVFDLALGGGWPLNQWNEIIGHESHGKTVMVLKTIAANMEADPEYTCLWAASEQFVYSWAELLGVDLNRIFLLESNVMEDVFQIVCDWLEARACDAVVIDSYPALISKAEYDKDMDELTMGGAKVMNQFMRKSGSAIKRSLTEPDRPVLGLIINQWREKIGVMHGDPRTTPGGKGKNFSFFTRVEVSRVDWLHDGAKSTPRIGITMRMKTIKNKTAPPERMAETDFYFADSSDGLHVAGRYDTVTDVVNTAMAYDIITRSGSWYEFGGQKWQGAEPVYAEVLADLTLQSAIDAEVRRIVLHEPTP